MPYVSIVKDSKLFRVSSKGYLSIIATTPIFGQFSSAVKPISMCTHGDN